MSIATAPVTSSPRQYHVRRCDFCDKHYPERYGYDVDFCREICKFRADARSLLRTLDYDHRYCSNCFKKGKDISPPGLSKRSAQKGKSIPECAIGTQTFRPHMRQGRGELLEPRDLVNHDAEHVAKGREVTRMVCDCEANHHRTTTRTRTLSKREVVRRTDRLTDALDALRAEEKHETDSNTDIIFTYVRQAKTEQRHEGHPRRLFRRGLALGIREAER